MSEASERRDPFVAMSELVELHRDISRRAQACHDLSYEARSTDQERLSAKGDGYDHAAELLQATIDRLRDREAGHG